MRRWICLAVAAVVAGTAGIAAAHEPGPMHGRHATARQATPDTEATRGFKAAHQQMMRNMEQPYTGDPDVDFRIQMIPHHQGAIAMARVALQHATNPWTKQLAESVIVEQQREIAEMQVWLEQHGAPVPAGGQPTHTIRAESYRTLHEEAGTRGEARGQSWAPGSGIR